MNTTDSAAATSTTQRHRPLLGNHDLGRRDGHHQQMLDGAVLALADERRAGEDDRQQRYLVDDLDDRREPRDVHALVETRAQRQIHHRRWTVAVPAHELDHLTHDDLLHVLVADERLADAGRVDVDLHRRRPTGQHVALEVGWNHQ
jgi:hypothetical protein